MVTTCHQGYQKEINQIVGLLETDRLEEEWTVLQGMLSESSNNNAFVYNVQKNYQG